MANTKPCYDCGDMLERAYTETRDAIRKFILENGVKLENGDVFLTFGKAAYVPSVLTYKMRRHEPDFWEEKFAIGLLVDAEYNSVWFYAVDYNDGAPREVLTKDMVYVNRDGIETFDYEHWHELDWDEKNSYQHNVERIAYFIGNHYEEECEGVDANAGYDTDGDDYPVWDDEAQAVAIEADVEDIDMEVLQRISDQLTNRLKAILADSNIPYITKVDEQERDDVDMRDVILQMAKDGKWICPIRFNEGDDSYYSISKDEIVMPHPGLYKSADDFCGVALHCMAHSTGAESRLNRLHPVSFGSNEYSIEELTVELTAAIICRRYAMSKHVHEDSLPYVKSWIDNVHEDYGYVRKVLHDVQKAGGMMLEIIEKYIEERNK